MGLIGYHAFGEGGRDGTVGGNKGILMGDESVGVRPQAGSGREERGCKRSWTI